MEQNSIYTGLMNVNKFLQAIHLHLGMDSPRKRVYEIYFQIYVWTEIC